MESGMLQSVEPAAVPFQTELRGDIDNLLSQGAVIHLALAGAVSHQLHINLQLHGPESLHKGGKHAVHNSQCLPAVGAVLVEHLGLLGMVLTEVPPATMPTL
jgi:hypothetical protein